MVRHTPDTLTVDVLFALATYVRRRACSIPRIVHRVQVQRLFICARYPLNMSGHKEQCPFRSREGRPCCGLDLAPIDPQVYSELLLHFQ